MAAFTCPACVDATGRPLGLDVETTRHPGAGVTTRYRRCAGCGHRVVTEERERPAPARHPVDPGVPG